MLKITSLTALIAGLLLATPIVFSDAEAGRSDASDVSADLRGDRAPNDRIENAFRLLGACDALGATCRTTVAEIPATVAPTVTVEQRDEAHQMSTLVRMPAKDPIAP
ncbi:MAG: hypothetical protein P4L82_11365 [Ancalomicrobiaceae bacterium]|nr:hypothetical protein [Ancalomicrobiaceae bacterium]